MSRNNPWSAPYSAEPILSFRCPPPHVGWYIVTDGFCIVLNKKPRWLHRVFTRMLLGWVWVDKE